jgi:hypothetical protein
MTRKLAIPFILITLSLLTIGIPLFAHHGTAGVYDYGHRITTKATVTQYIWANPHVQIYFTLKNDKGEEQTWGVETVSPGNALANGWTKNTFKAGDELLVSLVPAKGDRTFGTCTQIVFVKDGKRLGGNGRCGQGAEAVDMNTLPVKPGYTKVEVTLPKDTRTRPESEQEK